MIPDGELLQAYAETDSEEAFAELVRRHLDLVYSAALRQVNGDVHLAQDVAQAVFTDLARKAALLSRRLALTGWLYTSTHFAAAKALRTERRRQTHEQEAFAMNELLQSAAPDVDWEKLRPMLDRVMHELKASDREVILLRYFENRQLADIGRSLGLSEDTARKRVDRAVGKLRFLLARRGLGTVTTLGSVLSAHAVHNAPAGLASGLAGASMAGAATGTSLTCLKAITMTKFQTVTATVLVVAGLLTPLVIQQHAWASLRHQHRQLQAQADQAVQRQAANQKLAGQVAPAGPTLSPDQYLELLKLRGEVSVQQNELAKLKADLTARQSSATAMAQRAPVTTNYFPKSAWATAGNATPEAALQSLIWMMENVTNHNNLLSLLPQLGPAAQAAAAKEFAGKTDAEIDAEIRQEATHATNVIGLRILYEEFVTPDQMVITFYNDGQDGFGRLPLQRSGNFWRIGDFPVPP